jgi:3-hydroxyacyl-[acyl-carrier-protein] dehydratase
MPGDMLLLPVKMQKARMPVWRFAGEAYVNGKLCAEAEFTAMIAEPREKADN